jgi:asparagine synthase (glutamine-hydrolysing)
MEGFDRVAARYGVEPRHPWSDKRLVEFYLRLPLRQKARDGWTKYLVRKAMAPSLDADVRWHTGKHHLGMGLVRRLMEQSREQVLSSLRTSEEAVGQFVDICSLHARASCCDGGADDPGIYQLYEAVTLARWLTRVRMAT